MQRYKEIHEKPNLSLLILYFCWTNIWTRRTKVHQSIGLVGQARLYSIENSFPYIFCSNFALASLKLFHADALFDLLVQRRYYCFWKIWFHVIELICEMKVGFLGSSLRLGLMINVRLRRSADCQTLPCCDSTAVFLMHIHY